MTTRLRVQHVSRYDYEHPVPASFNEARLSAVATPWQEPLEATVVVDESTWQHSYVDYWGTRVRAFEALRSHKHLTITASNVVELDSSRLPVPDTTVSWKDLAGDRVRDAHSEFLLQSPATQPEDDLAAEAERLAAGLTPHEAALAICSFVHGQMSYVPGATGVHTEAREAWQVRAGVCQDYAHVVIGALRHIGLPARYVSGYLHPRPDAPTGETFTGESHAWVEWWLTDWVGHDPTNDASLAESHVLVGRAREYGDVPPIKGIVAGLGAAAELDVQVEVTRLS